MVKTLDNVTLTYDVTKLNEMIFNLLLSIQAEVSVLSSQVGALTTVILDYNNFLPGDVKESLSETLNKIDEIKITKQLELTAWFMQQYGK